MEIKPLTGQVLLRLLPTEAFSDGGLMLPDIYTGNEPGKKALPRKALVIAIGPWKKTKQGFALLPEIKVGEQVLVSEYLGTKLTRNIGENLRLCRIDDVLAILEETCDIKEAQLH